MVSSNISILIILFFQGLINMNFKLFPKDEFYIDEDACKHVSRWQEPTYAIYVCTLYCNYEKMVLSLSILFAHVGWLCRILLTATISLHLPFHRELASLFHNVSKYFSIAVFNAFCLTTGCSSRQRHVCFH